MKRIIALSCVAIALVGSLANAAREGVGFKVPVALQVNFISIGAGIDFELREQVEQLIAEETELGNVVDLRTEHPGFEGETQICVELKTVERVFEVEQKLRELHAQSKTPKLTSISTRGPCHFGMLP
jgi:hypothetical protein